MHFCSIIQVTHRVRTRRAAMKEKRRRRRKTGRVPRVRRRRRQRRAGRRLAVGIRRAAAGCPCRGRVWRGRLPWRKRAVSGRRAAATANQPNGTRHGSPRRLATTLLSWTNRRVTRRGSFRPITKKLPPLSGQSFENTQYVCIPYLT